MKWNSFDLISPSIEETKKRIFPFNFKEWVKLTVVSMLSDFGGGGGFNSGSGGGNTGSKGTGAVNSTITGNAISQSATSAGYWYWTLGIIGGIVLILGLIFSYIKSIFSFIYINALLNKKYSVRQNWEEYRVQGRALFSFKILMLFIFILITAIIFAYPVIKILSTGVQNYFTTSSITQILLNIIPFTIIFILFVIIYAIFSILVYDFALPELYFSNDGMKKAIRKTFSLINDQKTEIFLYLISKIVVAIVVAIIYLLTFIAGAMLVAIPGLLIYFIIGIASKVIAWIIIGVLALILIFALIIALLPIRLFKGYFIIENYEKLFNKKIKRNFSKA